MSILVVGSVALDDVETPFGKRTSALGGAAVYFGLAASYFTDVQIVGVVGTDFPQQHLDLLADRGIDLRGLQVRDGATFRWGGQYGYDLNARETAFTDLNVFAEFNPAIPEEYRQTEHVFLANIAPSLQLNVLDQMTAPQSAALDTMDFWIEGTPDELRRVLERVDIVLINDSETRELAQEPNIRTAANAILDWGPQLSQRTGYSRFRACRWKRSWIRLGPVTLLPAGFLGTSRRPGRSPPRASDGQRSTVPRWARFAARRFPSTGWLIWNPLKSILGSASSST